MHSPCPELLDGSQGRWANMTLGDFLEGAIDWAHHSEWALRPGPQPASPWALAACFLDAGRCYE